MLRLPTPARSGRAWLAVRAEGIGGSIPTPRSLLRLTKAVALKVPIAGGVRELPASEIYFDVDTKNAALIRSGSSYFKILGLPEEEFPSLARFEDAKIFTIAQKVLKDGSKKTFYAISTDETRYVLNGNLFSFKDNKQTLVATDGRRLACLFVGLRLRSTRMAIWTGTCKPTTRSPACPPCQVSARRVQPSADVGAGTVTAYFVDNG